jgi:hypothetical protein
MNIFKKALWSIREMLTSSYAIRAELKEIKRSLILKNEELYAFQQIAPYLGDKYFPLTGYVLSPLLIQKMMNEIQLNNCKNILEFGSGFSSIVICNFIIKNNLDVHFTSVDNNDEYLKFVMSYILKANDERVKFIGAPITENIKSTRAKKWYSNEELDLILNANKQYDLILVDGPYGKIAKNIRSVFIDACDKVYDENTIFYIDDTHREDERRIVNELTNRFEMEFCDYGTSTRLFKGDKYKV